MPASNSPQIGIYFDQHAGRNTTLHVDDGSFIDVSVRGTVQIDLFSAHVDTTATGLGPVVASGSVPALSKLTTATGSPIILAWASGAASAVIVAPLIVPADYDPGTTATLYFYGEKASGANASAGMVANMWWNTSAALSGASAAVFTSSPSAKGVGIASGLATAGPINIAFWPDTHANDALWIYGAWLSYKRKI